MPYTFYGKRYHGKKVRRIQRAWRKHRKHKGVKKQLKKLTKKVNAITNKNWVDISQAPFNVTTSATYHVLALDQIAEGTADSQRIGREITVTSWSIKGNLKNSPDDQFNNIRMMIIQVPEYDAQPTSQFLQDPSTYLSHYKKNGDCLFKILYDKTVITNNHAILNQNYTPTRPETMNFTIKSSSLSRWKPMKCRFRSGTAVPPDRNNLLLLYISDSGFATHPTIEYKMRLNFNP